MPGEVYMKREEWSSYLRGRTLELQQHHGAGTLHDVEVEQQSLVPVTTLSEDENAAHRRVWEVSLTCLHVHVEKGI